MISTSARADPFSVSATSRSTGCHVTRNDRSPTPTFPKSGRFAYRTLVVHWIGRGLFEIHPRLFARIGSVFLPAERFSSRSDWRELPDAACATGEGADRCAIPGLHL